MRTVMSSLTALVITFSAAIAHADDISVNDQGICEELLDSIELNRTMRDNNLAQSKLFRNSHPLSSDFMREMAEEYQTHIDIQQSRYDQLCFSTNLIG